MTATMTTAPPTAGMPMPSSEAQVRAAQRILDVHPELTLGEALAILAIALDALGVIEHG